jgi:Lipocalin-like domain
MLDSDLRQALLGTWRLISFQVDVDGRLVKPFGDNPQGYLVYTPEELVFVQFTTRAERSWPGPEVLEMSRPKAAAALGFWAYCGTFEVRDGQAIHQMEFGILPSLSGRIEPRSVMLDGDQLILGTPLAGQFEWRRVTIDN